MVFEAVSGEVVEPSVTARFYPDVVAGTGTLVWATRRRMTREELVQAWPAREEAGPAEIARGWWLPTIEVVGEEGRKAAFLERAQATRRSGAMR